MIDRVVTAVVAETKYEVYPLSQMLYPLWCALPLSRTLSSGVSRRSPICLAKCEGSSRGLRVPLNLVSAGGLALC
jgi:hypothetical protein